METTVSEMMRSETPQLVANSTLPRTKNSAPYFSPTMPIRICNTHQTRERVPDRSALS
ncbi:MAG: Uncharacterised protein [Flavobacteriia bacterium]|nr:MAG: Uncharacterised protein [Flavobacteriia bacterium]